MSARFNEAETWEQLRVPFDEAVVERWVVPMWPCGRKAGMSAAGQVIVRALDDELGAGECIVVAGVVNVEVGADDGVDLGWLEVVSSEMLKDVCFVARLRAICGPSFRSDASVDEDVAAGGCLDEIAR